MNSNNENYEKYSTFFPDSLNPQEVIDVITEAYQNRIFGKNGDCKGMTSRGFEVQLHFDKKGKIKIAYPVAF